MQLEFVVLFNYYLILLGYELEILSPTMGRVYGRELLHVSASNNECYVLWD